jgi:hypothetical protein
MKICPIVAELFHANEQMEGKEIILAFSQFFEHAIKMDFQQF